MEFPDKVLWPGVVLVVIVSVLLSELANWLLSFGSVRPGLILFNSPFLATFVLTLLMIIMIFLTFYIGKMFGGIGALRDTIGLVIWLQTTMILLQVIQLMLIPLLPNIAMALGLFAGVIFFWIYVNFIKVLHGFNSIGKVFFGVIGSMIGVIFAFSLLIGSLLSLFSFGV
tara:strand:+ start:1494 stop:2003 length:510 start_codon:yes stop_codon:yes gene_type:complete